MKFNLKYHQSLIKRYGFKAILFLFRSKFLKNKLANRKVAGLKYPVHLSNYSADVSTFFQILYAKEYEIPSLQNPKFIIDCGANIGLSAVYFANKYPNTKIVAIEPDKNNFEFLKLNTSNYPNVICIQKAVWSHSTKLEMVDPGSGNWGLQTRECTVSEISTIDVITIDDILFQFHFATIDLIKIDIEGAEKELFSHNYEGWLSRTRTIAIELHDFLDPTISSIFYKAIEPYGFKKYNLGENLICERELD